jgi:hypothetical protein
MFTLISALRACHLPCAQLPMDGGDIFIQLANHYWTKSTSTTFLPSFFPDISRNLGFPSPFIVYIPLISPLPLSIQSSPSKKPSKKKSPFPWNLKKQTLSSLKNTIFDWLLGFCSKRRRNKPSPLLWFEVQSWWCLCSVHLMPYVQNHLDRSPTSRSVLPKKGTGQKLSLWRRAW